MKIATLDPKKNSSVICGNYDEDTKTFTKKVTHKHYMRIVGGYGIQEDVFEKLLVLGCQKIVIETPNQVYSSYIDTWTKPGIRVMNFGSGNQRFLGIKDMISGRV